MIQNTTIYEQPLNELIRACLRLEQLFLQIDHETADTSTIGTRNVIFTIINLLQLVDRPDLKAKLAKELTHQMALLNRLSHTPEIDQNKLNSLLRQLDELSRYFIEDSKKIGQPLREIELLNNLRLHLASPGGGCSFDIPMFYYWLQQPIEERQATLKTWMSEFDSIRTAALLLLQLIRESSKFQQKTAVHGFYQELLDPQLNLRLIRVGIPKDIPAYPEISIGRHFLGVRCFSPSVHERPSQCLEELTIWISHCNS